MNIQTTAKETPPHSSAARPAPVRVSETETPDDGTGRVPPAPAEQQPPNDEPGYGHGV
ncbi:MAG: hypothetical protein ABI868_11765 [Acidobacteriota bacterium]